MLHRDLPTPGTYHDAVSGLKSMANQLRDDAVTLHGFAARLASTPGIPPHIVGVLKSAAQQMDGAAGWLGQGSVQLGSEVERLG